MIRVAVLGLGEAGSALAADLVAAGVDVHGFDPGDVATPPGVTRHADAASAVGDAELVIAVTTAANAEAALVQALPAVGPGTVYADLSTGSPGLKRRLDETAGTAGVGFADVALMAPVPGRGLHTPAVASGRAAARFVEIVRPLGMPVEHDGDVAGQAATRKLLRSIVMKGLAGVLRESMEAARRAGLADETWSNVVDQLSNADEPLLRRLAEGPAAHATRRVEEMEAAEQLLVELGVEPTMTRATVASLRQLAGGVHGGEHVARQR
jgi:3-hydroxyisobutyrate dehydrogenase-like beta-hydroxyacid dehydrogenase